MQTIKINAKTDKALGSGAYGKVYPLSKYRVVKIPYPSRSPEQRFLYLLDELDGVKQAPAFCLPIIRIVRVKFTDHHEKTTVCYGCVKRRLYNQTSYEQCDNYCRRLKRRLGRRGDDTARKMLWDFRCANVMRDGKRKYWLIDTGTRGGWDIDALDDHKAKERVQNILKEANVESIEQYLEEVVNGHKTKRKPRRSKSNPGGEAPQPIQQHQLGTAAPPAKL